MKKTLLITDFDGTLADTFKANLQSYQEAFAECGLTLDEEVYRRCFGLRFKEFMRVIGINDENLCERIHKLKGEKYPTHFELLRANEPLKMMLRAFRQAGGKTAIASTAQRANLEAALRAIHADDLFDLVLCGEEVSHGKPNPEIYLKVLSHFNEKAENALVFEDSDTGMQAAENAGIDYIQIKENYF